MEDTIIHCEFVEYKRKLVMDAELVIDTDLTHEGFRLLAFLLSRGGRWQMRHSFMTKILGSEYRYRKAKKNLRDLGYIDTVPHHDGQSGRLMGHKWRISKVKGAFTNQCDDDELIVIEEPETQQSPKILTECVNTIQSGDNHPSPSGDKQHVSISDTLLITMHNKEEIPTEDLIGNKEETPYIPQGGIEQDNRFDDFWKVWPKKVAKHPAEKAWGKVKAEDRQKAIDDICKRKNLDESWLKSNGQFIPNPATYLNGKRWQDEWTPIETKSGNTQLDLFGRGAVDNRGKITKFPSKQKQNADYLRQQMLREMQSEQSQHGEEASYG